LTITLQENFKVNKQTTLPKIIDNLAQGCDKRPEGCDKRPEGYQQTSRRLKITN